MDMTCTRLRVIAIALLSCTWAAACGDDGDGARVSSGLPPEQRLSELDDDDVRMACESVADGLDGVLTEQERERIECTGQAVPLSVELQNGEPSVDVAMCKQLVNRCVGGESIGDEGEMAFDLDFTSDIDCEDDPMTSQFEDCDATVAEYEDCLNAALAEMDRFFAMINCDAFADLNDQQGPADGFDLESLPACEALMDQCPAIDLGGSSEAVENGDPGVGEPAANGCDNTCGFADDGECDDGGPDSDTPICALGTDCNDCGPR